MTDRPADSSDDFFPPFAPARPNRPAGQDAAGGADASDTFAPFTPAPRRAADASPEPATPAASMPWDTAPAADEAVVDTGIDEDASAASADDDGQAYGTVDEDAGDAYDMPWLEVSADAADEVGEGAAAVSPLGGDAAAEATPAAGDEGVVPWNGFGAAASEAGAQPAEEPVSPPPAVESYASADAAARDADTPAGELGLMPVGEFGAGEAEQPPVAYAPPVPEDEEEPPIGTVSGPDDVIAARLCEVADRLESIAGTLRDRSPAEVLGGAAGDDPLGLLVTGFVLGYLQRGG